MLGNRAGKKARTRGFHAPFFNFGIPAQPPVARADESSVPMNPPHPPHEFLCTDHLPPGMPDTFTIWAHGRERDGLQAHDGPLQRIDRTRLATCRRDSGQLAPLSPSPANPSSAPPPNMLRRSTQAHTEAQEGRL